jgi:NADPH:quinone reductase-like Zn-dependent oxidoreductase
VTAIQIAKALGAIVVTAGSDDKCTACLALGLAPSVQIN